MRLLMGLAWLLAASMVASHGGGLNAQGCHNNRKTVDYRCHGGGAATSAPIPRSSFAPASSARSTGGSYANCTEARNAGAAPVRRGDLGYGSHLDRDNDGGRCE